VALDGMVSFQIGRALDDLSKWCICTTTHFEARSSGFGIGMERRFDNPLFIVVDLCTVQLLHNTLLIAFPGINPLSSHRPFTLHFFQYLQRFRI
jgi:hypothetical protein